MKSRNINPVVGEFYLSNAQIRLFAPVSLSDEVGETLAEEVEDHLEQSLEAIKVAIEEKFPNIRVGYSQT